MKTRSRELLACSPRRVRARAGGAEVGTHTALLVLLLVAAAAAPGAVGDAAAGRDHVVAPGWDAADAVHRGRRIASAVAALEGADAASAPRLADQEREQHDEPLQPHLLPDGQHVVDAVFQRRFVRLLTNATARAAVEAELDVLLAAPAAYLGRAVFERPPAELQEELPARPALQAAMALLQHAHGGSSAQDLQRELHGLSHAVAQLDRLGGCYPVTRRVILGCIVRLRMRMLLASSGSDGGSATAATAATDAWTGQVWELVYRICQQLRAQHQRGAAYKGVVEFLHVSKSGGTSMCSIAAQNGCSVQNPSNYGNCMVRRFDDKPRWVSKDVHQLTAPPSDKDKWHFFDRYLVPRGGARTCTYRDAFMRVKNHTFYSNEYAVHGGLQNYSTAHLCPEFVNVVLLREPGARLLSHINWIIRVYWNEFTSVEVLKSFFEGRDAAYWRSLAPAAVDNYYCRLLLGEAAFHEPVGALGATHLAAARLMLLQYDLVLVLEAQDGNHLLTQQGLGWQVGLASTKARVVWKALRSNSSNFLAQLVPSGVAELVASNGLDMQLHSFGVLLQSLDAFMFEALAEQEQAHGASTPAHHARASAHHRGSPGGAAGNATCGYLMAAEQLLGAQRVVHDKVKYPRIYSPDDKPRKRQAVHEGGGAADGTALPTLDPEDDDDDDSGERRRAQES